MSPVDRAQLRADLVRFTRERCEEKDGTIRDETVVVGFAFLELYAATSITGAASIEQGIDELCKTIRDNYPLIYGRAVKAMLDVQPETGEARN